MEGERESEEKVGEKNKIQRGETREGNQKKENKE